MEANELRIGNYVIYGGSEVKMNINEFIHFVRFPETYEPIPLTEEWILKLGLKRGGYDMIEVWHPDKPRFVMVGYLDDEEDNDYIGWNYNHEGTTEEEYGSSRIEIRYVHQLQNLYFALTGDDLHPLK